MRANRRTDNDDQDKGMLWMLFKMQVAFAGARVLGSIVSLILTVVVAVILVAIAQSAWGIDVIGMLQTAWESFIASMKSLGTYLA